MAWFRNPVSSSRVERFVSAWSYVCGGFFLGFAVCGYWFEHYQPQSYMRVLIYQFIWPAVGIIGFTPRALLEIFRGLRRHRQLEQQMHDRTGLEPPASL